MKKTISLLLVFCFLVALLPAVGLTASAGGDEAGVLRELYFCGFETQAEFDQWTNLDYDGKANGWIRQTGSAIAPEGEGFAASYSFINGSDGRFDGNTGAQSPDNWLVSPKLQLPESDDITLTFEVFTLYTGAPAEKYAVMIHPTDGNLHIVHGEVLTAADGYANSKSVSADISSFAGQEVEIILRHFDCTDQLAIGMDCIGISYVDTANTEIETMGVTVQEPKAGEEILHTGIATTEGYYVADVSWDPVEQYFTAGKSYTATVTLEAKEGYFFPHRDSTRPTINGNEAHLLSHSADQIKFTYTFPEVAAALPAFLEVSYNYDEVDIVIGEPVLMEATCTNLPAAAEDITYQWYATDDPRLLGEALYGATGKSLGFSGDVVGTIYFHCRISCNVGGVVISTNPEEFATLKVNISAGGRPSMFFDDVTTADWFYGDVEYVYYNGLMNGTSTTTFSPQLSTTRGMIVTILYRLEGSPEVTGTCPFSDVPAGTYYEAPITWAAENEIVNGMGDGTFAPESNITREQLAAIFFRYAKYKGIYDEDDCVMTGGFKDQDAVSPWAYEAMSWAIGVGLIGGSNESDGLYLLPQGNALRCQVAAILHRFCNYFFD
ncbi:MAG: S-layer homology domain-containing protein [Oscillospiraceae bacterium]|nr:S-layer homology domain-containing protein [Oscillospiraceae bacterium]